MMLKQALFRGEHLGEQLVSVINPGEMVKTAGIRPEVQAFCDSLKPCAEYTYVLVNAMGNSWYYGSNSNTDWYGYNPHLDFDGLLHTWPDIGADIRADQMKGKAWPYGYPCFYASTVFAHHKNTNPQQLGFGDVIFASYNPRMKRVELVMRVFNAEARKKGHESILDRIRAGERVDVSMGTKVPFDLCSICTDWAAVKAAWKTYDPQQHRHPGVAILASHKRIKPIRGLAVTKADYCKHMTTQRGKILPDGRRVFVYNDFCRFFDISFVWIGADRTARVMWHRSGEQQLWQPQPVAANSLDRLVRSLGLTKSASIEKEIPDGVARAVHADADAAPEMSMDHLELMAKRHGPPQLLTALGGLGIIPKPREFQAIVLASIDGGPMMRRMLDRRNVCFDTDAPGLDGSAAVDPELFDNGLAQSFSDLLSSRSAFAPFLNRRLLSPTKTASAAPRAVRNDLLDKIAAQYSGYRVSVLENADQLFPKVGSVLDPSWLLEKDASGLGMAGLLLGAGPMLHLLSSHLRKKREAGSELGSMATLTADNPSFVTLTTVGAALRAAMEIERHGGLASAAKTLFRAVAKAA